MDLGARATSGAPLAARRTDAYQVDGAAIAVVLGPLGWSGPAGAALTGASGTVVLLAASPQSVELDALTSSTQAFVFAERTCFILSSDLRVDAINPVGTFSQSQTQPGTIPAGTPVDSYYVHSDLPGTTGQAQMGGTLTFDRPVLGLIFRIPTLNASDPVVGAPGTTYPSSATWARGYEEATDTVTVSPDRRTVTFQARIFEWQDELRIITEGTCEPGVVPCTVTGAGDIVGTEGDDVICGSAGPDRIAALGGNDTIFGGGGNDDIAAGPGNDTVFGGAGDDDLAGEDGNDRLYGGAGLDRLAGDAGDDFLFTADGDPGDRLVGGAHFAGDVCRGDPGDPAAECNP